MQPQRNVPFSRADMKACPPIKQEFVTNEKGYKELRTVFSGFTPSTVTPNNRERRAMARNARRPHLTTNSKASRGVKLQVIPETVVVHTKWGDVRQPTGRFRKVLHISSRRIMNI